MKHCENCDGKLHKSEHLCSYCGYKVPINTPIIYNFWSKSYKFSGVIFILVIISLLSNSFFNVTSSDSLITTNQEAVSEMLATKIKSIK